MDDEKLGVSGIESAGECDSVIESSLIVGGETEEAPSLEDESVAVGGGAEHGRENHAAGRELGVFGEGVVEMVKMSAVDGGGEVITSEDGDSSLVMEETGAERVDFSEMEVPAEEEKAPVADESLVSMEDDKPVIDAGLDMKTEEEIEPVIDAKLRTDVTDSEMQMDATKDEIFADPQLEMKAEKEFRPLVDPKMEVVDTEAGYEQQLAEFQTDAGGGGLDLVEGTVAWNHGQEERELGDEENVGAMGRVENESLERLIVENNTETTERCDEVAEDKHCFMENDLEVGSVENLTVVEEEGDHVIIADPPITDVETDVSVHLINVCEQEHGEDRALAPDDCVLHGTEMVDDDKLSMEVLSDAKLDDHLSEAEYKEDVLVKADFPVGDTKPEEESGVESEATRNAVVEHLSEDAEVETEMRTNSIDSITPDDYGKLEIEDTVSDVDEPGRDMYDSPGVLQDGEDKTNVAEEEIGAQDTEMETETDLADSGKTSGGKRKRANLLRSLSITKAKGKISSRKKVGEDVCFICFDGGELVLCDRRGCPKAYHPSCVNRDEAFFRSKGRWNCGWHLCSICEKNARYMCYTCTFSLCKSCTKDAVILCVRGNKGFCETCMRTIKLIENNEQGDTVALINFDDRSSWEYLFKDYYIDLKAKLSLSSVEIAEAKNPWRGADISATSKTKSPEMHAFANDGGSGSDESIKNSEAIRPKRRKIRRQSKPHSKKEEPVDSGDKAVSLSDNSAWASRELLEFVSHMKNGNTSVLSQFDVQALLLEYIKRNKLRDPRRKSQIVCDGRLENLFGKPRVGHFEMLKLLESHFLTRDEHYDDVQGSVVDTENDQLDIDASPETLTKGVKDKKRKAHKKGERGPQSNLDDFAAIDMHNIGLIYLRRKLMENLLEDTETFNEKVVGTFVRIRISGNNQKQDLYRLVQVVGSSKTAEHYKVGKKTTDTMVEILNLDKTEIVSIDTLSNQEFTEDECKRLRQSIKCGLISRLTVGEILDKTMEILVARVNDWLESETLRLSHLRDRASDLGRRKELRECIEKLQLLKTPEERCRRLEEIPEIHADPKMDPGYESDDKDSENEDARRDSFMRSRGSGSSKRGRGPISPGRDNYVKDSWTSSGKSTPSRNLSGNNFAANTAHVGEILNESSWNLERERSTQESTTKSAELALRAASRPESTSGVVKPPSQGPSSAGVAEPAVKVNESEKIWHYKDPAGKVQGPFSMVQLRKWNNTGYFPTDMKMWRAKDTQENSVILVDALAGKFPNELPAVITYPARNTLDSSNSLAGHPAKISGASLLQNNERSKMKQSSDVLSNLPSDKWSANDTANLPSPTPKQRSAGWSGGEASLLTVTVHSPSVNGGLPSPTAVLPNLATHSPSPASVLNSAVRNTNFSPTPISHQGILVSSVVPSHSPTTSMTEPHIAQMLPHTPAEIPPVQAVTSQNLSADTQVWGSGAQSVQAQGYGWAASNVQSSSGSFPNSGPVAGIQPDVWRPSQSSQQNMHSPTTANASWSMGPAENNTPMAVRPQNSNVSWGAMQANPSMGWGNPAPGNTNVNWGPAMPPSGNSSCWTPHPGNTGGTMQGMVPGNANPYWGATQGWGAPPSRGLTPGSGWGPPGGSIGPGQGNANQGWAPWGGEQNQGGGQYSGQRGGQGREAGFGGGGGRPWNRPSLFDGGPGGGGSRLRKADTLCPFNANGQCRKGSRCDFLHN